MKKKAITFRLDEQTLELFKKKLKQKGAKMTCVLILAIEDYIKSKGQKRGLRVALKVHNELGRKYTKQT